MEIFIKGKKIHYERFGSGEPLLFVHGWKGNSKSLSILAKSFEATHTCYLIDLPGRGSSDNPNPDWGIVEYADVLVEFINTVIGKSTSYIGHSYGGALGVYLASTSTVIDRLVLCAPSFLRVKRDKVESEVGGLRKLLKKIKLLRKLFYKVFYPNSELLKLEHLESNFIKIINTDISHLLPKISVKTQIIWGADDIDTPLYHAHILNRGIKGSHINIYSSVGHELPVYYPELIEKDVKLFLKSK